MSLPLKEIVRIGKKRLEDCGVADSERDAKLLYCHQAKISEAGLVMRWTDVLQDNQCEAYFDLIEKRAARIPLQHITGEQEFMGLKFKVSPDVLVPRQDTETMVEDALEYIKKGTLRGESYGSGKKFGGEILDLCTGSGAIGVSLAKLGEGVKVTCSDISDRALETAASNAGLNQVKSVKFIKSDMLENLKGTFGKKKFDMIISNPPYIEREVIKTLEPEVRDHEPNMALDGGEDGLDFYRIIAEKAADHLKKDGILMLEIGYNQREAVKDLLRESDRFDRIVGLTDLAGQDRIVVALLKKEDSKNGK